jgi:hypothetical protein
VPFIPRLKSLGFSGKNINREDLVTIMNYSIGKAILKYKICGKYWGLLGKIFINEIYDTLRSMIEDKGGRKKSKRRKY